MDDFAIRVIRGKILASAGVCRRLASMTPVLVLGGFYKLISWDFGVVFEQIAVQNEEA